MKTPSFSLFTMLLIAASLVTRLSSFAINSRRTSSLRMGQRGLAMSSNLSKADTDRLIVQANAWCALNGLLYSAGDMKYTMAPVALVPNTFSKSAFEYAQSMQPILNELVDVISRDRDFLTSNLLSVSKSDDFVKRLLDIYGSLSDEVIKDSVHLGLHRSDYMINVDATGTETPLQVEINTIASSFGCLSKKVGDLHRYLLLRNKAAQGYKSLLHETSEEHSGALEDLTQAASMIPENASIKMLAFGLSMAHFVFGDPLASVLFIVQPGEKNIADQRMLEQELWTVHGVRVEFMTLKQIAENSRLGEGNCLLVRPNGDGPITGTKTNRDVKVATVEGIEGDDEEVEGEILISVAYYRAGYTPDDYPTETEWAARALIEKSSATKCPTVAYQLVGTKKIQQALCEAGVVERFIEEAEAIKLRKCFAAQYSLGPPSFGASKESVAATEAAVEEATKDGSRWVLKPQREGGGNNLYGEELSQFLVKNKNGTVLGGYVLMQRIFPKPQMTAFLRKGELQVLPSISELGVYGVFLGDGASTPLLNTCAGYLLRTKPNGVDEGGVAAGFSVLSSVILVDKKEG